MKDILNYYEQFKTKRTLGKIYASSLYLNPSNFDNNKVNLFLNGEGIVEREILREPIQNAWIKREYQNIGRVVLPEGINWQQFLKIAAQTSERLVASKEKLHYMQIVGGYGYVENEGILKQIEFSVIPKWRETIAGLYAPMAIGQDIPSHIPYNGPEANTKNIFYIRDQIKSRMTNLEYGLLYQSSEAYTPRESVIRPF